MLNWLYLSLSPFSCPSKDNDRNPSYWLPQGQRNGAGMGDHHTIISVVGGGTELLYMCHLPCLLLKFYRPFSDAGKAGRTGYILRAGSHISEEFGGQRNDLM